jgi:hypothetical protein
MREHEPLLDTPSAGMQTFGVTSCPASSSTFSATLSPRPCPTSASTNTVVPPSRTGTSVSRAPPMARMRLPDQRSSGMWTASHMRTTAPSDPGHCGAVSASPCACARADMSAA